MGFAASLPRCKSWPCYTQAVNVLFKKRFSQTKKRAPKNDGARSRKAGKGCPFTPRPIKLSFNPHMLSSSHVFRRCKTLQRIPMKVFGMIFPTRDLGAVVGEEGLTLGHSQTHSES